MPTAPRTASTRSSSRPTIRGPGRAEQDPDEWWSALVGAVRGVIDESGVRPEQIAGISTDATASTVVALDADGAHLRPAIMWMDVRADGQAARVARPATRR